MSYTINKAVNNSPQGGTHALQLRMYPHALLKRGSNCMVNVIRKFSASTGASYRATLADVYQLLDPVRNAFDFRAAVEP